MRNSICSKAIFTSIVLAAAAYAAPASAEIVNCTEISSLPASITTQGVYCLKGHLTSSMASGAAITVNTNNVTIDCNDFKVGNLAAGPATNAVGFAADKRLNVTVRNCGIRGFRSAMELTNGMYRIEDNLLDHNTQTGAIISGDGSVIRRNEVNDTGGSTIGGVKNFHGIYANGETDIIDNTVTGVMATPRSNGTAYGIRSQGMNGGVIKGNRVRKLAAVGLGSNLGIWNEDGNRNSVEGNTVILNGGLLSGDVGIRCGGGLVLNGASRLNTVLGTGVVGLVRGLLNCTSVVNGGDYVNPL